MKLLLTAVGKRVQLVKYLKRSFEVIGTDCSCLAPASYFTDKFHQVARYDKAEYKSQLLDICEKENIDVVLSVFEQESEVLDSIRDKLKKIGAFLVLPDKGVLSICNDKWETYRFFKDNKVSTPISYLSPEECKDKFPLFIKPRVGMGSVQAFKVKNGYELDFYFKIVENAILQEFIEGTEYTIDCFCNSKGSPVSIVPRERLEVRAGEVSKSRTCKDESLMNAAKYVCEKLKPMGPITIQCIKNKRGGISFIEINPRMGGGVPLSFEAGANYSQYIMDLVLGKDSAVDIGNFKELTMMRYDEAVFI